ncbi:hypothetical protein EST38_g10019 [Candolleomyces aberdarensis]|uniref:F-box domain-containing protein n=1 Tax=Candolleomyces aberdarensis TaxID=2316362 RepID=A0A4Q2DAW1_9AGAR|nr:hypothetical protein EST38_g10019 [Candolleomyces aberdarensis]
MPLDIQLVSIKRKGSVSDKDELPVSSFIIQLIEPIGGSLTHLLLNDVTFDNVFPLSLSSLPSLEQLVLSFDEYSADPKNASALTFANAPALRRVSFSGSLEEETDRRVIFPWSQLTHFLCCNIPDYCDFFLLTYLPLCNQLRFLYFDLHNRENKQSYLKNFRNTMPNRVILPNLETFNLDFGNLSIPYHHESLYPNMLFPFELPNLRKLQLAFDCIDGSTITPAFLNELRRLESVEHLSLTIDYCRNSRTTGPDIETPLRDIFGALPNIKTLELSLSLDYSHSLDGLTLSVQQDLLPNLLTLALTFDFTQHYKGFIHPDILTQFVNSRTQFKKITILDCGWNVPNLGHPTLELIREALRPFISRGLVQDIRHVPMPSRRWIYVDPELRAWPELLELY